MKDLADDGFYFRGKNELNALFEQGFNGTETSGKVLISGSIRCREQVGSPAWCS